MNAGRVSADLRRTRSRPRRWLVDPALPEEGLVNGSGGGGEGVVEVQQWGMPVRRVQVPSASEPFLLPSGEAFLLPSAALPSAELHSTTSSSLTTVEVMEGGHGGGSVHIEVDGEERARLRETEQRRARERDLSPSNMSPLHTPTQSPDVSVHGSRPHTTSRPHYDRLGHDNNV